MNRLRWAMVGLATAGLAIAAYLTYVHVSGAEPICAVSGGCEKVQSSEYAELAGIPVAVLGLAGYGAILATFALRGEPALVSRALLVAIGFAFSVYLTYLELFVIEAICQWCVASAIVLAALMVLVVVEFLRSP